jgi:DNA-binding Lrp family transcriptional regulator
LQYAYVLLTTEIGAEKQVVKALKKIDGVEEVHTLWGVYDILAQIHAEDIEALKLILNKHIERISKINSKLTMIVNEKQPAFESQLIVDQPQIIQ